MIELWPASSSRGRRLRTLQQSLPSNDAILCAVVSNGRGAFAGTCRRCAELAAGAEPVTGKQAIVESLTP